MKVFLWSLAVLLLIVPAALAQTGAGDRGPAGALPDLSRPIGPIPGPASRKAEKKGPYARDPVALMEGRKLFVAMNCAGCHGGHAGGGMGPSLRDQSWIYGGKSGEIFDSIAEGRARGMPAWGTLLPRDTIRKLVAYIESLRQPWEPQPPR
jgi:cytochrome c oxidase cbb3-type subunit 3